MLRFCFYGAVFGLLGLCLTPKGHAWTFDQAKAQLLENNPEIKIQEAIAQVAPIRLKIAKANQYPFIQLRGGTRRFLQENERTGFRTFIGPRLTMPIYRGGYLKAQTRLAEQRLGSNARQGQTLQDQKITQLQKLFANAIYAKHEYQMAQNNKKRAAQNVRLVDLRYQSGMEYRWVLKSAQKSLEIQRLGLMEAQIRQDRILTDMERIMGELPIKSLNEINEEGFYPSPVSTQNIDLDQALEAHPEVLEQQDLSFQKEINYISAKAKRLPNVIFNTDFVLFNTDDETNTQPFIIPFWSAEIGLSMPIYAFGKYKLTQKLAEIERRKQALSSQNTQKNLKLQLKERIQNYELNQQRAEIAKLDLEAAKDRSKVTTELYQNGLTTFSAWDRAERELDRTEKQILVRKRDWMLSHINLMELIGRHD